MAKLKVKNIESLANELNNKFNGAFSSSLKIGVVAFSDNFSSRNYAQELAQMVEREIVKNGIEAETIVMPSINERFRTFTSGNYVLDAHKKQISNYLELMLYEKAFDGVVFIPNSLTSTLGSLASSIRLNLPTIVLPQGLTPVKDGANLKDILSYPGKIATGEKSVFDLDENQKKFSEVYGSGSTLNGENLFNIILEVMELSVKNSATTYAQTYEKDAQALLTAQTIVSLTKNRLPLRKLINKKSILNAINLNFCLGGSPIVIDALMFLSKEAELDFDTTKVLNSSKNIPVLYNTNLGIETFIENGGTWALIKAMIKNKIIDGNYKTFADTTLIDETKKISNYENFNIVKKESIVLLRGNIADRYAIAKTINIPEEKTKIISNAQVFSSDEEACNAVLNKAVTENSVIVIKECGKNVETGVSTISQTTLALESMGLTNNHIVVTDGFVPDDTTAICISCVYPDSNGGNIRFVKDGDEVEIDFVKGKLNIEVNSREMTLRQKKFIKEKRILPKYLTMLNNNK